MWRTALGTLIGTLAGIATTVLILYAAFQVNAMLTYPKTYEIEHGAIYLTIVLGAGFGSVCGALAGFASALLRQWRTTNSTNKTNPHE